jgi:short-subunit dehydrogenase
MKGTILITGASSGLGAEMARQFAVLGYDLALCARRTERLEALADELRPLGRRIEVAALDVTDDGAAFEVFQKFTADFGRLDRVVVNAGVSQGAAPGTGHVAGNRSTVMTNFVGALTQTEAAMEIFRRQRHGHLVFISSVSAMRGMRGHLNIYAATKAGLSSLAEGIRVEGVPGVDVTVIHVGYIRTELTDRYEMNLPFIVDAHTGVRAIVKAVEKRRPKAFAPAWPWSVIGPLLKTLPFRLVRRLL